MNYRSTYSELSVKDVDTANRTVCGYFSTWGKVDTYNEQMARGCFAKSIAENGPVSAKPRIAHLWGHDAFGGMPIGRLKVLLEDEHGLYFESKIANTTKGNDVLTLYQEGVIREHSVGYKLIKATRTEGLPTIIQEVKLYEGSTVVFGANEDALFTGIKSKPEAMAITKGIRRVLRSATISNETAQDLEIQLKLIEALFETDAAQCTEVKKQPPIDLVKMYQNS